MSSKPLFRIRSDRFEVLQGGSYMSIDRSRIDAVHYHSNVLTVRYVQGSGVTLDCTAAPAGDLKKMLQVLQGQRDRNREKRRLSRKKNDSASNLPGTG